MKSVVLDTSIVSFTLNASPLVAPYRQFIDGSDLIISFQTVAEVRLGASVAGWGSRRLSELETHLAGMTTIGYSEDLGLHWVSIMADARRVGRRLETGDAWIAATALMLNAPLLTHDRDLDQSACPSITVHCFS